MVDEEVEEEALLNHLGAVLGDGKGVEEKVKCSVVGAGEAYCAGNSFDGGTVTFHPDVVV
jgi:hypothetical protein